mgnify:CR=1 FL=1
MPRRRLLACACLAVLAASQAAAQQSPIAAPVEDQRDGAVRVYAPAFFEPFNAQTALDMVRRVPGFAIESGGGRRGLAGGLGNVLIDGARPSSKNGLEAILSRLPASSIERIELIRAAVPGVDMAGQNEVVNVIVTPGGGWSGAWRARLLAFESGRLTPRGEVSASRADAASTLSVSIELAGWGGGNDNDYRTTTGAGALVSTETERFQDNYRDLEPALSYARDFVDGSALRIDARASRWRSSDSQIATVFDASGSPDVIEDGDYLTDTWFGEATSDYSRDLNEAWGAKLTFFQSLMTQDGEDVFERINARDGSILATRIVDEEVEGETVLRGELRRADDAERALTFTLEGAYNFLDGSIDIFTDDGTGEIQLDLPISDTRVEEHRVDATVTRLWRAAPKWTVEAGLGAEFSRIAQTGDGEQERTFTYFKPRAIATWALSEDDQLRFTAERDVGQLDFDDFISSVDLNDDNTDIGNPDLEPERTWRLQAEWERRIAEDASFTLLARQEWVEGVEGFVPVGPNGLQDAPGNLGDGWRWRLQADATAPLDRLGITGGLLTLNAMVRETHVDDPVTGEDRRFRFDEDWRVRIDFRQDLPERGFAWGFDYFVQGREDSFRVDQFNRTTDPRGDLDMFAEVRPGALTVRAGADFRFGEQERLRYIWADTRAIGEPVRVERRLRDFDGSVYVEVSGVF